MAEAKEPLRPAAWMRIFASTLNRLYPKTGAVRAARIANERYKTDAGVDPVSAAELYALEEGPPKESTS